MNPDEDDFDRMRDKIEKDVIRMSADIERAGVKLIYQCLRCGAIIYDFREVPRHFFCKLDMTLLEGSEIPGFPVKDRQHKEAPWIRITAQNRVLACQRCGLKTMKGTAQSDREFINKHKKCLIK
jgi:DNA-directed RNA polymerase subunit RPC12/RpoP